MPSGTYHNYHTPYSTYHNQRVPYCTYDDRFTERAVCAGLSGAKGGGDRPSSAGCYGFPESTVSCAARVFSLEGGGSAVIDSNDLGAPRRGVMDCGIRLPAQRRGGERSAGAGGAVSCSWRNSGGAGPGDP